MSSSCGSSHSGSFCATSTTSRSSRKSACSSAEIDFARETKSGVTIWGNTTTSRRGIRGDMVVVRSAIGMVSSSYLDEVVLSGYLALELGFARKLQEL